MIKRVFWVALFTGLSHLISLITISYVIRNLGEEVSGYIGIIDSSVILVASVVSFGIQLAVNRNVATKSSWKSNYQLAQSARLTLSLFVIVFGAVLYMLNSEMQYLIYAFAPLVALNGDYALYGNGKPITASSLSFLRVAAPNLGILVASYLGGLEVIYIYIFLLAIGIFLAGLIAARANQVPCHTLRPNTERPSTVSLGTNTLVPFSIDEILALVEQINDGSYKKGEIPPLWDGKSTERIVDKLLKL